MKTLEEIKSHLSTTVYDEESKQTIAGFLIGKEIGKEEGLLDIEFDLPKSFEDFKSWFDDPSKNYFQRKDSIVNDGKVLLEDELKNEKSELKAKAYQDGKWFDVTFDEICGNLKKYNPVICDGVMPDDILEKIYKELIGEEEPKYKYVGEEREELKKDKKTLIGIIESNEKYLKYEAIDNDPFDFIVKFSNEQCKAKLDDIERKLHETVD